MTYKTELQTYVATLDDTIDSIATLGAKLQEFSLALDLASGVVEAVDTIGDLADEARKSIDTQLTVLKLTKLAGPLKLPSKIFEKVLKTMQPVIEKIDSAVDKLNGKKDSGGPGDDGQGEFLDKLSTALNQAGDSLGDVADDLLQQARDLSETRDAMNEFIHALDKASFAEYDALKLQVEAQIAERNALTAPLAAAFSDVTDSVNDVLGIIAGAEFSLVNQSVGDFADISGLLGKIGDPLEVVAAIIKPIEWLLNSVGFIVDLVLGPIFSFITSTLGIDKVIQDVADDIKDLLPDADFLDPLVDGVQGLLDSVRDFQTSAFGINGLLSDIDARLYGGTVGNALLGPTGIGDDTSETLQGDAGDDLLDARGGDDTVLGGAGNDVIVAGEGDDLYFGGDGTDMVYFGGFFNEYELAKNSDGRIVVTHVRPAPGTQNEGSTVLDSIEHVVWNNISFTGAELEDAIIGGSVLNGTNDDDLMFLNSAGTPNSDGLHEANGLGGDDRIFGSTANDQLNGGAGNDVLLPGLGNDEANGGAGSDSYQILSSASTIGVRVDLLDGTVFGNEGTDTLNSVENLILQGKGDHRVSGDAADNNLLTAAGGDVVSGRGGDDFFNTGDGKDFVITGAGRDRVLTGGDNDFIIAASLTVAGENEFFDGGHGWFDVLSYSRDFNVVRDLASPDVFQDQEINARLRELNGDTGSLRIDAGTGIIQKLDAGGAVIATDRAVNIEVFVGSDSDDVLTGALRSYPNSLEIHGGGGNDTMFSNGADQVSGGDGDDRLTLTMSGSERTVGNFDGGAGQDILDLRAAGDGRWWLDLIGASGTKGSVYDEGYFGGLRGGGGSLGSIGILGFEEIFLGNGSSLIDFDPGGTTSKLIVHTGSGDDVLFSTGGIVEFDAGGGDDTAWLDARATVRGGRGDDRMAFDNPSSGNEAFGGQGNDRVTLERFNDSLAMGGKGYDTLVFDTQGFAMTVDLRAGTAIDTGSSNTRTIDATIAGFERVVGSEFSDVIRGARADETLIGREGNDQIAGRSGDDQLFGGVGSDTLTGGKGNDRLHGGAGNDILKGGKGRDTAVYSYAAPDGPEAAQTAGNFGGVTVDLALGSASGSFGTDTLSGIEDVVGSIGDDTLRGDDKRNVLSGEAGDDTLFGQGGNDVLILGSGDDTAFGGAGNDRFIVGVGANTVSGGNGNDRMEFGTESGRITLDFTAGEFSGTLRVARPVWQDTGTIEARLFNGVSLTPQQVKETQALYSDSFDDLTRVLPSDGDPMAGMFRIVDKTAPAQTQGTFSGIEKVVGGNASVNILLSAGLDSYDGTRSDGDILDFSSNSGGIEFNLETGITNYILAKGDDLKGIDGVRGGAGGDLFTGDDRGNLLLGGGGHDRLVGGGGADRLSGGTGRDFLAGGQGKDVLKGGLGRDVLNGGRGDDRLLGGGGKDKLKGGKGADTFVFAPGDGRDRIVDFQDDIDQLDLRENGFAGLTDALNRATNVNGDTLFDFGAGDTLLVKDITKAELSDDILI